MAWKPTIGTLATQASWQASTIVSTRDPVSPVVRPGITSSTMSSEKTDEPGSSTSSACADQVPIC
jgi:hypothetical protein